MKKTILSLGLLLVAGSTYTFAQNAIQQAPIAAEVTTSNQSLDVNPKEATRNVNYKMQGGKTLVLVDEYKNGAVFIEKTTSTPGEDNYSIYSADGKRLIATYAVGKRANDIKMVIVKDNTVKAFMLGEYLARAGSDLERDAMKHKLPVYWLYRNGYSK